MHTFQGTEKQRPINNTNPTWKNIKRPSCRQKLVTGKPPWPRQGISFRGPLQLGQHFPAEEEQERVTTGAQPHPRRRRWSRQ